MESIVFLEDIKTVEMFYLQAQLLISQVSVIVRLALYNFECIVCLWL